MSEETTQNFGGRESFEALVLTELRSINSRLTSMEGRLAALEGRVDALDGRLTSLEEKVEARLHDTRPIWEAVMARLTIIEKKLDIFAKDMMHLRAEVELLQERLPPAA